MGSVLFALCTREIRKAILLNCRSGVSALTSKINIEGHSSVIAYWLIPAEPAHRFFQRLIEDLARRYDAPLFEPHVTIHVGANYPDAAEKTLSRTAREWRLTQTPYSSTMRYGLPVLRSAGAETL